MYTRLNCILTAIVLGAFCLGAPAQPGNGLAGEDFECHLPDMVGPNGLYVSNRWPGVVPYQFNSAVTPANQQKARDAMATIEAACSVRFVPRATETNYLDIRNGSSNFSSRIGMFGGEQYITISTWNAHFLIVHELMHVLGAWHEQQRGDRNQYVTINFTNIPSNMQNDFVIKTGTTYGWYDFDSVMHYRRFSSTSNGLPTIEPAPAYARFKYYIGQHTHLSTGDNWLLSEMYPGTPRPPATFDFVAPSENAIVGRGWSPAFSWTPATLADCYRLLVDNDPYFRSPAIDVTITGTSYSGGSLAADRLYYWTVQARNSAGVTQPMIIPVRAFYTGTSIPPVLYVDDSAPPGGNGTSWADAMSDLQSALGLAASAGGAAVEIRTGAGTYRPDRGSGDRYASFVLRSNVTIRGSYAGFGAPDPDARDAVVHPTILSGDLAGNDGPDFQNNGDNSMHVIWLAGQRAAPVTLDGLIIRAGNADGYWPNEGTGAGLWADDCNLVVNNCVFSGCMSSSDGAGLYLQACDTQFRRCLFESNRALPEVFARGAGLAAEFGPGSILLDSCIQCDLHAFRAGGAFLLWTNCTATNSVFLNNHASRGGGGVLANASPTVMQNCRFHGNVADGVIDGFGYGGAFLPSNGTTATLINCVMTGNSAATAGGAIEAENNAVLTLRNCTVTANSAPTAGGLYITNETGGSTTAQVLNTILHGNANSQIALIAGASATVTYSDIEGGWAGTGNINADPLFLDLDGPDNVLGTADDDVHLFAGSPCIDAGDPAVSPPGGFDIDQELRIWDGNGDGVARLDIGSDEYGSHVLGDLNCDGPLDGLDIQAFLLALVDAGAYGAANPGCNSILADFDGDGVVGAADVVALVEKLLAS